MIKKTQNTPQLTAVQKMQDYIQNHLFEEVSLYDLSVECNYSPWYCYRIFESFTGYSPSSYIRRLRLSQSALKLRDDATKVTDVAFLVGFNSVDGYQRAFYKEFGCNPGEFAKQPVPIFLFKPYGVLYQKIKEKTYMKEIKNVFVSVRQLPARKVLIKRGTSAEDYWTYCQEVGCDIWGLLLSIKSISGEPVCLWLPQKYVKPNTSVYVQGVEVQPDYDGIVPEGFDTIDLPEAKYLAFIGEPFKEEDFEDAIDQVKSAIDKFNPQSLGYVWDTTNPRIQLEPIGERGYIELLPVLDKN